jgi:hypothetical protein
MADRPRAVAQLFLPNLVQAKQDEGEIVVIHGGFATRLW